MYPVLDEIGESVESRLRQEIHDAASNVLEQAHIQFAEILKRQPEAGQQLLDGIVRRVEAAEGRIKELESSLRRAEYTSRLILVGLHKASEAMLDFTSSQLYESDTIITIGEGKVKP